jgi:hypothetical protein
VFDEHYREKFRAKGLLKRTGGELCHFLSDVASMQVHDERTTCCVTHAAYDVLRAPCTMQLNGYPALHATYDVQLATCSIQDSRCSVETPCDQTTLQDTMRHTGYPMERRRLGHVRAQL